MTDASIVGLKDAELAIWRRIIRPDAPEGVPREWADVSYVSPDGQLACGIWCAEAGTLPIRDYPVDETCWISIGQVVLEDSQGTRRTYDAGSAFVLPRGFTGTWTMESPAVKQFAMYGPKAVVSAILAAMEQEPTTHAIRRA